MLQKILEQLKNFWQRQTNTQRLILVVFSIVFVVVLVFCLTGQRRQRMEWLLAVLMMQTPAR